MNLKFTKNAVEAMNNASRVAQQLGHDHVGCEHVLLALLAIPGCQAVRRLELLGHSAAELAETLRNMIAGETAPVQVRGPLPVTARLKKMLDIARQLAGENQAIDTVHLVVAMLREGENAAGQLLTNAGVTVERFVTALSQAPAADAGAAGEAAQPGSAGEPGEAEVESVHRGANGKAQKTPTVNAFGRDLTELARQGKLDPVIGRERELQRLLQILSRRTKNNAVLIGEAGVGKTAVAEALAQAIHTGRVPEKLQNRRVVALDMARVVAGTQYRGQFEERLKRIVDETRRSGNIILFLDEIHTLVGAGGAEGAMDAANILKPALARGELQCVGATTLKEYHHSIEKDAALERRFQSVLVEEPTLPEAVEILRGVAPKYEEHHAVKFTPAALTAAVELTARYLPARQLPDKAIDALDETGARLRMGASRRPPELLRRQEELDTLRGEKDAHIREGDFDAAAQCRAEIQRLSAEFAAALAKWRETHAEEVLEAAEADIAATVAGMSGVPVEKLSETTAARLLKLEADLGAAVVGQAEALGAVARSLRRSRAFPSDGRRPVGSFLFLGPTGVGKTHLAKMLAEKVFGDEKALITIDMSEYQEKYSSSRLVGSPPGYVGHDEGGQLTEKVRRRPYSVVLFDEFEKADGDVCNMLLQILDDGRLTDGQGRVIDFRNTIVLCTANLGFDFTRAGQSLGFASRTAATDPELLKEKLLAEAKRTFRPELLNRFDEIVVFHKLTPVDLGQILRLQLSELSRRVASVKPLKLDWDEAVEQFLVAKVENAELGARPLKRVVQKYLEDPLAELLLAGKAKAKVKVRLDSSGDHLKVS